MGGFSIGAKCTFAHIGGFGMSSGARYTLHSPHAFLSDSGSILHQIDR